jgi:hypothetical protein
LYLLGFLISSQVLKRSMGLSLSGLMNRMEKRRNKTYNL